jgi:transcriptional regulator with GAF, ATPase, and Fis domain
MAELKFGPTAVGYRLQVFGIRLPPLRERPEDILPLSAPFLEEIGRSFGRADRAGASGAR